MTFLEVDVPHSEGQPVSSVFWDSNGEVVSDEPWSKALEHGADLLDEELKGSAESVLDSLRINYGMSADQFKLSAEISRRKIESPPALIVLSEHETELIRSMAASTEAFEICKQLFREIDIFYWDSFTK